jgi:hypothetical protein
VIEYLDHRKRTPAIREKVVLRFEKFLKQLVSIGGTRIKGMSIKEATLSGSLLIEEADYCFLMELRNCQKGLFMSVLFDNLNEIYNKNRK